MNLIQQITNALVWSLERVISNPRLYVRDGPPEDFSNIPVAWPVLFDIDYNVGFSEGPLAGDSARYVFHVWVAVDRRNFTSVLYQYLAKQGPRSIRQQLYKDLEVPGGDNPWNAMDASLNVMRGRVGREWQQGGSSQGAISGLGSVPPYVFPVGVIQVEVLV